MNNKFFSLLFILIFTKNICEYSPINLDADILKKMDGIIRIIDGNAVRIEYQVLNSIAEITLGKLNSATKKREGILNHQNSKKNLKQMVIEEAKLSRELQALAMTVRDAYIQPSNVKDSELRNKVLNAKAAFLEAKQIFKDATFPFLDTIQHFKFLVIDLMKDCCNKRNKPDSLILKWAEAAGNEEAVYNKYMLTATEFDVFLSDLTLFLRDMIHNCPKAKKQFEEWYLNKK